MDAKRWPEIRALFDELVELDPERQADRLATVAAADRDVAGAVEALLAADLDAEARLAKAGSHFRSPAVERRPLHIQATARGSSRPRRPDVFTFSRPRGQYGGSPGDPRIRIALGLAYAGLGRNTDASREARTAVDLVSLAHDNPAATGAMGGAVEVFARLGETDAALQLLELLLGIPAGREVSVPLLRTDPIFAPLRSDPRFDAMIERFSRN